MIGIAKQPRCRFFVWGNNSGKWNVASMNRIGDQMKYQTIFFLLTLLIASCAPATSQSFPPDTIVTNPPGDTMPANEPSTNPLGPKPSDGKLTRGSAFIQESGLLIRESYPPQISLTVSGDLPNPCHELRVGVSVPDAENKILADVYTVVDPNMSCIQVLKPFRENIDLGTFQSGHYTVWVNGEMVGEFDS